MINKIVLVFFMIIFPVRTMAGADGALYGLGQALSRIGEDRMRQQNAEQQMRLQQQMEIQREDRAYQYELMQRRQQEEFARQAAERRKVADEKAAEEYRIQQIQIIQMHHPDWRSVVESQAFNDWKIMLPFETKKALDSTWDGAYISEAISAFKEYEVKNKKHNKKRKKP